MANISLRDLLEKKQVVTVAGAHDALSARLAELCGFDAIWLSSLGVSTALRALPDLNLITMSESLQVARNMNSRTSIPLIADCENGYGDENNVRHTVYEFERAGVAAICIDDNSYPKRNSFYSASRALISVDSMSSKIRAACQARVSEHVLIIARTEGLISGLRTSELLERVTEYKNAGADALIIQSRTWIDIITFLKFWDSSLLPLIVIPTGFPEISIDEIQKAGFRMIVYANQALRAATQAMKQVLMALHDEKPRTLIEQEIVSLTDLATIVGLNDFVIPEPE
jgi:phosphoenolpyruvate phosphomutase